MDPSAPLDPKQFFAGAPVGWQVFQALAAAVDLMGEHEVRTGHSQVSFRRRKTFLLLWRPGQYVRSDVPVVVSIPLGHRLASRRFKEVTQVGAHAWMHHLEVRRVEEVDDEVLAWVGQAYDGAA